jgi:hypothetical protein
LPEGAEALAFLFELLIYAVVDTLIQLGVVAAFRGVIEPFLTDRTENLFIAAAVGYAYTAWCAA